MRLLFINGETVRVHCGVCRLSVWSCLRLNRVDGLNYLIKWVELWLTYTVIYICLMTRTRYFDVISITLQCKNKTHIVKYIISLNYHPTVIKIYRKKCIISLCGWPKLQITRGGININSKISLVGLIYKSIYGVKFR